MSAPVQPVVHTPGPWRVDGWNIIGSDNAIAAKVIPWDNSVNKQETVANAALMSASPELLAATKSMLELCERFLGPMLAGGQIAQARAAIAKATGEVV